MVTRIMFLTRAQKRVLEAIGKDAINFKVADDNLKMKRSTMHSINSNIFENFVEALEVMDEYFSIFEGRIKRRGGDESDVWDLMRSLRLKIKRMEG